MGCMIQSGDWGSNGQGDKGLCCEEKSNIYLYNVRKRLKWLINSQWADGTKGVVRNPQDCIMEGIREMFI